VTFSPWEFSLMPWFHCSWTEKPLSGFPFVLHDSVDPLWTGPSIFLSKVNWSTSKMCISFGGRSDVSIVSITSICWTLGNPEQWNNDLASSVKADAMPNDWAPRLLQQTTHIHNWTRHFSFWIKNYISKILILVQNHWIQWPSDRVGADGRL
jgi:hypothetical protein